MGTATKGQHHMAHSAITVANTFLKLAWDGGKPLDHMKLQKLVYYAHGWHLAIAGEPLIREGVQAWWFGPVVEPLYQRLKEYGSEPIADLADAIEVVDGKVKRTTPEIHEGSDEHAIVSRVWDLYSRYTAIQLSNAAHKKGTPWELVESEWPGRPRRGAEIPDDLIESCFKQMLAL